MPDENSLSEPDFCFGGGNAANSRQASVPLHDYLALKKLYLTMRKSHADPG